MKVIHVSAECYPAAKAGGLGDVAGALPKYLNKIGTDASVVMPKYQTKWIHAQHWTVVHQGHIQLGQENVYFNIQKQTYREKADLGFPLYVVDIPGKYDREGVYMDAYTGYGYKDETERAICFQLAVLYWMGTWAEKPDVVHCHDHHTGLIPFLMKYGFHFRDMGLSHIPTVFTIHNGEYQGAFRWNKMHLLPPFEMMAGGLLEWNGVISPLACAVKCAWKVTTVSQGYLEELQYHSGSLTWLLNNERHKSVGILNGIDTAVWNPATDHLIEKQLARSVDTFKKANKAAILKRYNLDSSRPLFTFIGRLVGEKGAQLLPEVISNFLNAGGNGSFAVLGTGDPHLHEVFSQMKHHYSGRFDAKLEYNEGLAHQLYAGSDFLMMPSKVEPCGLNQMYALRYGTIPVVRAIGGLKDTIQDIGFEDGTGIRFDHFSVHDCFNAIRRAAMLYDNQDFFKTVRNRGMQVDFSWDRSAQEYQNLYKELV